MHNRPSYNLIAAFAVVLAGCNSRQPTVQTSDGPVRRSEPTEDLAVSIREELRKPPDTAVSRRLVDQLNSYLNAQSDEHRPAPLSADERSMLEKEFGLRPEEIKEVARPEFTAMDSQYFDESLLLRDIARSFDIESLPPLAKAEFATAWVARNLRGVPATGPAVPLFFSLTRGSASPLERTYILFALLQHLGVDVALIGDAGAPDGIWAVGVLADGQVNLFDARLGLPLPGPDGKGVLTLEQARTLSEPFKSLAVDPKTPYDVTADRAKRAEIFISAPLTAFSPRMRFLQKLVGDEAGRVSGDPLAQRDRFRSAAGGAAVRFWCPPVVDALPRLLFAFLPATLGGGDPSPASRSRLGQYLLDLVPLDMLPAYLRLSGEPGDRIRMQFQSRIMSLSQPGQAHDLILRGLFRDATEQLVAAQTQAKQRPANKTDLEKNSEEWANAARSYAADLSRKQQGKLDPAALERMEQNHQTAERLWRSPQGPVMLIEYVVGDPLAAEATYLLGLCKQEEAERAEQHGDRPGPEGWANAQHWWQSFLSEYPGHPWTSAAQRNLARALAAGGRRDEAKEMYQSAANWASTPFDRLACRYFAEKLK
jgi:hypothetical protein